MSDISGQIQEMEIGIQAIIESEAEKDELKTTLEHLEEQNATLGQCLKESMAALSGANQITGNEIQDARAYDDARMVVGTIGHVKAGGATTRIGEMTAHHRSRFIGGTIEKSIALQFMK
jgi:GTPase